jgi:hypothetical protein
MKQKIMCCANENKIDNSKSTKCFLQSHNEMVVEGFVLKGWSVFYGEMQRRGDVEEVWSVV